MKVTNIKVIERENDNWKNYKKAPRIHVFVTKETIFDNLSNRHVRPHTLYKKVAVQPALIAMGFDPADCIVKWSQTAGCSCRCSPGFLISSKSGKYLPRIDAYVDVEGEDAEVAADKQPRELPIPTSTGVIVPRNAQELISALLNQTIEK